MIRGIDLSNFAGVASRDVHAIRAIACSENVQRALLGCEFPDWFAGQADACLRAGLDIEAWIFLYNRNSRWGDHGSYVDQVQEAVRTISGRPVGRLWLDLEDDSGVLPTEQDIVNAINSTFPYDTGVYTAAWYWTRISNPQIGRLVPLWHAQYDNDPSSYEVNYGGWLRCRVKQYAAGYTSYGVTMDLDAWEGA